MQKQQELTKSLTQKETLLTLRIALTPNGVLNIRSAKIIIKMLWAIMPTIKIFPIFVWYPKLINMGKINSVTRVASDPYIIILDEPYILKKVNFENHARPKEIKEWYGLSTKFISLKEGHLRMKIYTGQLFYEMAFWIEPLKLHVSCSCGNRVSGLCYHAYKYLHSLTYSLETRHFEQFKPDGLVDFALQNRKLFTITNTVHGLSVRPAVELGDVYDIAFSGEDPQLRKALKLPRRIDTANLTAAADITYMVVCSPQDRFLPFILPCRGTLNKSRSNVKGFHDFLISDSVDFSFTKDQKELNSISNLMFKGKEKRSAILYENDDKGNEFVSDYLELWERAFSLLESEKYVYTYSCHALRYLKQKPSKMYTTRITVSHYTPIFKFLLVDKGAYCQFKMNIYVNERALKNPKFMGTFFLLGNDTLYKLRSLRDSAIMQWFAKYNGIITILKRDIADFEQKYLKVIRKCYVIDDRSNYIQSAART